MLPTKFASVRYKSRPAARRASFRDDTRLVALRYDKTVAAEPPIPVPARNPLRTARRPSSSSTSRGEPEPESAWSSSSSHHHGPVVVSPPDHPPVAPPAEQHPALRTPAPPSRSVAVVEDWKRDSGHAATSSPSPTIPEEDDEDGFCCSKTDEPAGVASVKHIEEQGQEQQEEQAAATPEPQGQAPLGRSSMSSDTAHADGDESNSTARPRRRSSAASSPSAYSPPSGRASPAASETTQTPQTSHRQRRLSSPSGLAKSFSFRSVSLMRTRSPRHSAEISGPPPPSGPTRPLMRGSSPPPATAGPSAECAAQPRRPSATTATTATTAATATTATKSPRSPARFWTRTKSAASSSSASSTISDAGGFSPLAVPIPTDSLVDDDFMTGLSFSKRGSIMLGGQRALAIDGTMDSQQLPDKAGATATSAPVSASQPSPTSTPAPAPAPTTTLEPAATNPPQLEARSSATTTTTTTTNTDATPPPASQDNARDLMPPPDIRVLSADVERESQKVRSLYSVGDALKWEDGAGNSQPECLEPTPEAALEEEDGEKNKELDDVPSPALLNPTLATPRSGSSLSQRTDNASKETDSLGALEDWDDLEGAYVDRYGFISAPRPGSRLGTPTEMRSAQFSPRRRNVLQKRDPTRLSSPLGASRTPSRKVSARSLNTQNSEMSTASFRSSRSVIRQAGNLLPHNRNRRWMDEAGDMLAVSPSLQDVGEEIKAEKMSEAMKRKEWERSEKWRKMAKVPKKDTQGQGTEFEFDVKNPKLIERTWKGIPDRWRAAAWWSFMAVSAKNCEDSPKEEDIIADFHRLQRRGSPDDVQIDLDVPRTISRHIMFRRRYRGGQRLMFRVLHALSIYFPVTGYVQGMASLAATLLCYFDEEKSFVMLVWMWQLRGLDRLYRPGFEGLMTALNEFETLWLNKDVANKLAELCVDSTAYGTRWYLTLFNLSVPFPAQLRVWDVFLLLGGSPPESTASTKQQAKDGAAASPSPPTGLDVLHATSAALIQALREVLLDSDFENVMRALTSWIQIKDEDLLMKVTKAEWKTHQGKRKP